MARNITFEARTDVGRERSENQDWFGSSRQESVEFFIVCDGMGGHAGGSTASRLAVKTIEESLAEPGGNPDERMEQALQAANRAIFTMSMERRELRGMGTTAVILAINHDEDTAHLTHVGDSRIYRLRGGVFQRMTRDHTMVQRLVDEGIITEEEAENHPNSNVISRSLGGHASVDVEHAPERLPLEEGDVFLLCSDGLSGLIREDEMARLLSSLPEDAAAERLIERANEEGGYDNITVEVVRIGDRPEPHTGDFEIVHPPRGPSAREREGLPPLAAHVDADSAEPGRFADEPPFVVAPVPDENTTPSEEIPVEDGGTLRLLLILGTLTALLLTLVVLLLVRVLDRSDEVDATEVPAIPAVEAPEEPPLDLQWLPTEDEELEPQPAYEVPLEVLEQEQVEDEQAEGEQEAGEPARHTDEERPRDAGSPPAVERRTRDAAAPPTGADRPSDAGGRTRDADEQQAPTATTPPSDEERSRDADDQDAPAAANPSENPDGDRDVTPPGDTDAAPDEAPDEAPAADTPASP